MIILNVEANYYFIDENTVGINCSNYDQTKVLIIDPYIELERTWATYFGGTGQELILSNTIDMVQNKLYFVGRTLTNPFPNSILFNPGAPYYFTSNAGFVSNNDAFICRTDLQGVIDWCTLVFGTAD